MKQSTVNIYAVGNKKLDTIGFNDGHINKILFWHKASKYQIDITKKMLIDNYDECTTFKLFKTEDEAKKYRYFMYESHSFGADYPIFKVEIDKKTDENFVANQVYIELNNQDECKDEPKDSSVSAIAIREFDLKKKIDDKYKQIAKDNRTDVKKDQIRWLTATCYANKKTVSATRDEAITTHRLLSTM